MTKHKDGSDQRQIRPGQRILRARAVWITAGQRNEKQANMNPNPAKDLTGIRIALSLQVWSNE